MDIKIEQAVIIAGGRGTRLKPFTDTAPKPMYPIGGVPFVEHLIKQVRSFGIKKVVMLLGYLPNIIMDYLGDGSSFDVSIQYDVTPENYETGDRILHAKDLLEDEFLFMYCDNYCPIQFRRLLNDHIVSRS